MSDLYGNIENLRRFDIKAMGSVFEVFIVHEDGGYAEQAAYAAFGVVERLEAELSRYVETSDISIVNNLEAEKKYTLGLDTFECLKQCQNLYEDTGGAFDVTVGLLYDCWLDEDKKLREPGQEELEWAREHTGGGLYELDDEFVTVELKVSPLRIDLGGFGKGYAVDEMVKELRDWDIETALVHGGRSSIFGMGALEGLEGWPVVISNPLDREQVLASVFIRDAAINGSGVEKGDHIIDPRKGEPVKGRVGAWSVSSRAGVGDGLSTAFMIMSDDEIKRYFEGNEGVLGMVMKDGGEVERFGRWGEGGCLSFD